jgi:hypothetical protein
MEINKALKWKAIQNNLHQGDQGPIEVYDLHRDPGETFDLSQSHPHLLDQAKKIFKTSSIPSEHYFWKHQQQGDIATFNN